jgi:hypothetical protein
MADEVTYYTTDDTGAYVEAELPSFSDSIPEEIRDSEHIKGYGDAGAMAQALHDLKSNTPQIPETADGYTLPEMPETIQADTEALDGFKALAHELKLSQAQVEKIVNFDIERAKKYNELDTKSAEEAVEAIKKDREAAQAALDKEWGATKATKMELVAQVKTKFLDEDTIKKWDKSGFSDDPALIKLLGDFGASIGEGQLRLKDDGKPGEIPRGPDGRPILQYNKT